MTTALIDMRTKPTLTGRGVLLRPVSIDDVPGLLDMLADPEGNRLTGTQAEFDEETAGRWYSTRGEHDDRLDLAIIEVATGEYAGEVVLNDLDRGNRAVGFRIALRAGFQDRGLGSEATRLVVDYAFDTLGLHRIGLEVYAFNPRARYVYERAGFVYEGTLRDALLWDGEWFDAIEMAILATDPGRGSPGPDPATCPSGECPGAYLSQIPTGVVLRAPPAVKRTPARAAGDRLSTIRARTAVGWGGDSGYGAGSGPLVALITTRVGK